MAARRRSRSTFELHAYDGDYGARDRIANVSHHRIMERFPTAEAAKERLLQWFSSHPPIGTSDEMRNTGPRAHIEERFRDGGFSVVEKWLAPHANEWVRTR